MNLLNQIQNKLEKRVSSKSHDETVLVQSRQWMKSITWGLLATTTFGIAWLSLAKTEEIVVAPGKLQPVGSVKEIQIPIGGIADEVLVKEGDRVKAGQILIRLDRESSEQKNDSLKESLQLKDDQLILKKTEINRVKALYQQQINTLTGKILFEREILDRFSQLLKVGASAEVQFLQQRNKLEEVEGQLKQVKIDGLRQNSVHLQEIQRLKSEITEIKTQLTENAVTLRYQILKAPVDGIVFDLKPNGPGYSAQRSEVVMKIVPYNALEAKIEIPSRDIGFVKSGMSADISIDSFPATDFGVLEGIVKQVGSDALPPDPSEGQNEYRYPANIELISQVLKLKGSDSLQLQPGMSLTANIKLRKVSYLQLLLGSFQDKTDSLRIR